MKGWLEITLSQKNPERKEYVAGRFQKRREDGIRVIQRLADSGRGNYWRQRPIKNWNIIEECVA